MNLRTVRRVLLTYVLFDFLLGYAGIFPMLNMCAAQFTQVTGTVVDPNGLPYANGTIVSVLILPGGQSPTLNGLPYSPPTQPVGLDSTGSFTIQLADNAVLLPAATKWNFTVCSSQATVQPAAGKGPVCFTLAAPITITGLTQSITSNLVAAALALTNPTSAIATNIATTAPITGGPITTGAGTIACATCAVGPGASTAGHLASFSGTDGITLADSGSSLVPIFSTAVTGTSMVTAGTNTVIVGPVTMTTPGAAGSYRLTAEVIQTTPGSGGTCSTGTLVFNFSYKDADTGVTYVLGANGNLGFLTQQNGGGFAGLNMTNVANSNTTTWTALSKEFRSASGTAIQYQIVQVTNSNCTTPPVFAVRPALYYMGY